MEQEVGVAPEGGISTTTDNAKLYSLKITNIQCEIC